MADVLPLLLSFPEQAYDSQSEYDRDARSFTQSVQQIPDSNLVKSAETGESLLELLNPAVNSLAYLRVLLAYLQSYAGERFKSAKSIPALLHPPNGRLWQRINAFVASFDTIQTRYAGGNWVKFISFVYDIAALLETPAAGIPPIRTAMLRLDPSTGTFTTTHNLFVQLCLSARAYREALPILDNYIHSFPSAPMPSVESSLPCADHQLSSGYITPRSGLSNKITPIDVHEYFLMGAMCYIGSQLYDQARLFLEHVLGVPTQNVATGLMLEAYRKWVLVGCLLDGKVPSAPKTFNNAALKTMKSASKAYDNLAEIFEVGDMGRLHAEIEAGMGLWTEDGNLGLVQQLPIQRPRFFVTNLQKTYAALPIPTVADWLRQSPSETETYLKTLIGYGYINASVEPSTDASKPAVLRFYPDSSSGPLAKSEEQHYKELLAQISRTNQLAELVKAADQRLSLSREYIEHLKKRKLDKQLSGANMSEVMQVDSSWDAPDQDEDMMADLH